MTTTYYWLSSNCIHVETILFVSAVHSLYELDAMVTDESTTMSLVEGAGSAVCSLPTIWYCILASSEQGIQHALDRYSAACSGDVYELWNGIHE